MNKRFSKFVVPGCSSGRQPCWRLVAALYRPAYLSSAYYLGGLIFLQGLLAAIWKYQERFFPVLVVAFLWAGMSVPFSTVWTAGRWAVLALGAIVGFALYIRSEHPRFSTFHLVATFTVLAALVSAAVSSFPMLSFMKALSLLLLFLYASTGARLALGGREEKFFPRLLFVRGDGGVRLGSLLPGLAEAHLRQPQFFGRHHGRGGRPFALLGTVDGRRKDEATARHFRLHVERWPPFLQPGAGGNVSGRDHLFRDLRGFAALPAADSRNCRVLCASRSSLGCFGPFPGE